jgi:hypothetical protein
MGRNLKDEGSGSRPGRAPRRLLAAFSPAPHHFIGRLQMSPKAIRIEQRGTAPILIQAPAQRVEFLRPLRKIERVGFVFIQPFGDQFRQPHGAQQTARHSRRKRIARTAEHGRILEGRRDVGNHGIHIGLKLDR